MNREAIFEGIDTAREVADEKWGTNTPYTRHDYNKSLTVLTEEVGEIARAILEDDSEQMKAELFDVLQVCTAWLEAMED